MSCWQLLSINLAANITFQSAGILLKEHYYLYSSATLLGTPIQLLQLMKMCIGQSHGSTSVHLAKHTWSR